MKIETAKALTAPFDRSKLKSTQGMDYVPIAEVVARMNEVIGVGKWRVEILNTDTWGSKLTKQGTSPTHVIAGVRVHLLDDETNEWTWSDGMGGQDVGFFNTPREKWLKDKKYNKAQGSEPNGPDADVSSGPLNLGDNYKGACSDATKKALQLFGVGLELARDGQVLDISEPTVDLVPYITRQENGVDYLNDKQRAALKEAWRLKYGGEFYYTNVPERMERELKEFIDSFHVIDITEPETVEQPTLDVQWMDMTPEHALSELVLLFEGVFDHPEKAEPEANDILCESGYAENKTINEEEWSVLELMAEARIKQLQETVERPPLGVPA